MKKILAAILGVSVLTLSSCASNHDTKVDVAGVKADIPMKSIDPNSNDYAKIIAIPAIVDQLLNDKMTPTVGPKDAKKAVVVFYDYGCDNCTLTYGKMVKLIGDEPNVKFIFKAYPSLHRDATVPNYASLVANEAYLQGGAELFSAYNKIVYARREANGKLVNADIDAAIKQLGIKANEPKLKKQAAEEELLTRKVARLIGFKGPHSYVVLPTDLAKMTAEQLEDNIDQIYVIAFNEPDSAADYHESVDWAIQMIKSKLNNI